MKLLKRIILFGILGIIVLLIAAGVIVTLSINSIARRGIEVGSTSALGVPTTLKSASVGLFSGKFGLNGLDVANPQGGYPSTHFVQLGDAKVAVSLGSLTMDTIEIPSFTMDGLDVHLERRGGKSNYDIILENIEKFTGGKGKPKPAEPKQPGSEKKLIIKELTLRNITIHTDLVDAGTPGLSDLTKITVPIPEIKLTDVGKTGDGVGGSGVTIRELSSIIVQTIMAAVVEKGGVLPEQLLGELKTRLTSLGGLEGLKLSIITEAGGSVKALGEQFGAKVTDIGAGAKKALEDATKNLPGAEKIKDEAAKQIDKATDKLKGLLPKRDEPKKEEPKKEEPK
jgi:hypothetical protein